MRNFNKIWASVRWFSEDTRIEKQIGQIQVIMEFPLLFLEKYTKRINKW